MSNLYVGEGLLTRFEEKTTNSGKRVCAFSILLPERPREGQERKDGTFINVESWDISPQLAAHLAKNVKACRVFVKGRLKQDHWTDKATGAKRSTLKVIADRVSFVPLEKKEAKPAPAPAPNLDDQGNEIPF